MANFYGDPRTQSKNGKMNRTQDEAFIADPRNGEIPSVKQRVGRNNQQPSTGDMRPAKKKGLRTPSARKGGQNSESNSLND